MASTAAEGFQSICVVHLVRAANGLDPLDRFLQSYRDNPAGVEHELLVVYKGFGPGGPAREYRDRVETIRGPSRVRELHVADSGFDIEPYFAAMRSTPCDNLCFLNSFSILAHPDWLLRLATPLRRASVGLVGATASWESQYTRLLDTQREAGRGRWYKAPLDFLRRRELARRFEPFPNYHIRTNAFIMPRHVLLQVQRPRIHTKLDAHTFESGRNSLTQQVRAMGLQVLVVGKDGVEYPPEEWYNSGTFRQCDQANLLVEDNQTRRYVEADAVDRIRLARLSWGDKANVG